MDPDVVVDLEDRANPGRKATHEEMETEQANYDALEYNPEILEMRYLKARISSYRPDIAGPQTDEAANLAQFRTLSPDQQLAMVRYLEHMSTYVRTGESMASILARLAAAQGFLEESAVEDQGFIMEAGRMLSPVLGFLPSSLSNLLCVGASLIPHLPKMKASLQRFHETGDGRDLYRDRSKEIPPGVCDTGTYVAAPRQTEPVPTEAVVDLEPKNGE